jgi:hypothetical protein
MRSANRLSFAELWRTPSAQFTKDRPASPLCGRLERIAFLMPPPLR